MMSVKFSFHRAAVAGLLACAMAHPGVALALDDAISDTQTEEDVLPAAVELGDGVDTDGGTLTPADDEHEDELELTEPAGEVAWPDAPGAGEGPAQRADEGPAVEAWQEAGGGQAAADEVIPAASGAVVGADDVIPAAAAVPGEFWEAGQWYYREADGTLASGWRWLDAGQKWVYYDPSTRAMAHGQAHVPCGNNPGDAYHWYYFDDATGATTYQWKWIADQSKWVYYHPVTGTMTYGQAYVPCGNNPGDEAHWYYFDDATGATTYGWKHIDSQDKWVYYAQGWGWMTYGQAFVPCGNNPGDSSHWYYFDDVTGATTYGWKWIANQSKLVYYTPGSGWMTYGSATLDRMTYRFDSNTGALLNPVSVLPVGMSAEAFARLQANQYSTATAADVMSLALGSNLLQFADLRNPATGGITAAMIDQYIDSIAASYEAGWGSASALRGMGQAFIDAANQTNQNVVYLLAHAILESACGTSRLSNGSTGYHNFYGIAAFDSNPMNGATFASGQGWSTPEAAVVGGARWIASHYTNADLDGIGGSQKTLYEMRWDPWYTTARGTRSSHEYATGTTWSTEIAQLMRNAYNKMDVTPELSYVIPSFS